MNDSLTDTEKFAVMAMLYHEKFKNAASFARKIGASKQTVSYWYKREGARINPQYRVKICDIFNLQHTVWTDTFYDEINFQHSLPGYQKISKPISIQEEQQKELDLKIVGKNKNLTAAEEDRLASLSSMPYLEFSSIEIQNASPIFLFELVKLFKDRNQIVEALKIVDILQNGHSTFKYTFHNKIEHLKAVLLSHDQMQRWDDGIDILWLLYSASHYDLVEPEIITLMASNYKRKALSGSNGWKDKNDIDIDLLAMAFSLYSDAYKLKQIEDKYYDAVNMAYLINIINAVEPGENTTISTSKLYSDLITEWKINDENWWEVSSDAEILMLLGKVDIAISKLNDFFEHRHQDMEDFEIETTLRQLKMYLHFVDDNNAKQFHDYLQESWKLLKEGR